MLPSHPRGEDAAPTRRSGGDADQTSNLLPDCLLDARTIEVTGQRLPLTSADRVKVPPDPAFLSIRPEDVRLAPEGLPARVAFVRDLGESVQLVLDHAGQEVTTLFSPHERPPVAMGDAVNLAFAPGRRVVRAMSRAVAAMPGWLGMLPGAALVLFFLVPFGIMVAVSVALREPGGFYAWGFDLGGYRRFLSAMAAFLLLVAVAMVGLVLLPSRERGAPS